MKPKSIEHAAVVNAIEARLLSRLQAIGIKAGSKAGAKEEAAFLAGAASALHEIYGSEDGNLSAAVPPLWIIAPMSGRSVLVERAKANLSKGGAG